ncbi:epsin-1-like isoform X3 [Etheostoma cragini]|uniref:epsin-1-like isoform X3 n=1 Tax=Etheostoma cragini TaxID=417921 RepID=UPI00155DFD27|nr:epsin-1-like isoform X3 [Etheostoma cragini]
MTSSMLRRQLKNLVQNYSEAEVKVREATSNDPWGPSSTQMADLSDLTYNVVACNEIMTMLWKRLKDDKNWRHIHKSLTLLEYLLKTGDDRVLLKMKDNIYIVKALTEYRFVEKDGKDQGGNVREKAKVVLVLMEDDEKLKEERDFALKTREKTSKGSAASSTDAVTDPNYKPVYVPGTSGLPSLDNIPSVADLAASFAARKEERLKQEAEKKDAERRAKMSEEELKWEDAGKGSDAKGGAWGGEKAEEKEVKEPKEATDPWGTSAKPDTEASTDPWGAPAKTEEDPFSAPKTVENSFAAPKNEEDPFAAPKDDPFNTPKDDPFNAPKRDPFNAPNDDPFGTPRDDPFTAPASTPPKEDPFSAPALSKDDPFTASTTPPKEEPFSTPIKPPQDDPFTAATPPKEDPFAAPSKPTKDAPFTAATTPPKEDPFAAPSKPTKDAPFTAATTPPKDDPFAAATTPPKDDPFAAVTTPPKEDLLTVPSSPPEGDASDPFNAPPVTSPHGSADLWGAPASSPPATGSDPWGPPSAPKETKSGDPWGDGTSLSSPIDHSDAFKDTSNLDNDPWGAPAAALVSTGDAWGSPAPTLDSSSSSDPFGDGASKKSDPWGAPSNAPSNDTGKQTAQEEKLHKKTTSFLGSAGASLVDLDDLFSSNPKPEQRPLANKLVAQTQAIGAFKARGMTSAPVVKSGTVAGGFLPETSYSSPFGSTLAPSFGAPSPTFGAANPSSETPLFQLPSHTMSSYMGRTGMVQSVSVGGSPQMGLNVNPPFGGVGLVHSGIPVGNPLADSLSLGTGMGQSSFYGGYRQAGEAHLGGSTPPGGGGSPQFLSGSGSGETLNKNNPFLF